MIDISIDSIFKFSLIGLIIKFKNLPIIFHHIRIISIFIVIINILTTRHLNLVI